MKHSVKLVAITKPLIDECATAEELVAYCARVSNPSNQANHDTSSGLLKYCINHKHWSIFEMVHMVIEIECTRDIGRQILRHRSFSFQEFSQRYAAVDEKSFTNRDCRVQDKTNRQNSTPTDDMTLEVWFAEAQNHVQAVTTEFYGQALERGIAKEQARCLLPEGMTMSRMYMAGNLRSWIHYCQLRKANGTQLEHTWLADAAWEIAKEQFPSIGEALSEDI